MAIGLVTTLGVAFFLFFYETSTIRRAIIAGCAAFIGHAILFSFSRGAMLATVIFLGISFFIIRKTRIICVALCVVHLVSLANICNVYPRAITYHLIH